MYRISQIDDGNEDFLFVVPLGKNRFGKVVVFRVSQPEGEELGLEIFLREGHLTYSWTTFALMLILDDCVRVRVSLRCPLYSILCSSC